LQNWKLSFKHCDAWWPPKWALQPSPCCLGEFWAASSLMSFLFSPLYSVSHKKVLSDFLILSSHTGF
jgi:hypothetical protein